MSGTRVKVVHWTPRVLGLAFAVFLSVFALDVFGEGRSFWETAVALAMHLIPSVLVVLAVAAAWRRPLLGASASFLLALIHVIASRGHLHPSAYLLIDGPLFLMGCLYLLDRRSGWNSTPVQA